MKFNVQNFLQLLGGLGIFIYGMKLMSEGIQKVAGKKLRQIMHFMAGNRWRGVLSGFGLTAIIQSSSATTVMVVSFVNAGLMTLTQSAAIIMGANIGTTVTGWLLILQELAFEISISNLALPLIGISAPLLFSGIKKWKSFGEFAIGFGLLFMGLNFMKEAVNLGDDPSLFAFLGSMHSPSAINIILFVFLGTLLSIIVQSSSVALSITLVLVSQGILPIESAIAMLLGENIGTTITALLAALVGNIWAKRSAYIHLIFNLFGVLWVLIFFSSFISIIEYIVNLFIVSTNKPSYYYSLVLIVFHTTFNLCNTLIFIGFIPSLIKIVCRIVPEQSTTQFRTDLILGKNIIDTSEIAIMEAMGEIKKQLTIIQTIFEDILDVLKNNRNTNGLFEDVPKKEVVIENSRKSTANFLSELSRTNISEDTSNMVVNMLGVLKDLDMLADASFKLSFNLKDIDELDRQFIPKINKNLIQAAEMIHEYSKNTLAEMSNSLNSEDTEQIADKLEIRINELLSSLKAKINKKKNVSNMSLHESVLIRELLASLEKYADHSYNLYAVITNVS